MAFMPGWIGRLRSTTCSSRKAAGCWLPRSRTTSKGCGRCAERWCGSRFELVAIERPDGLLVKRRLDAGLRVLPLHRNQLAASRDRFRVSGGKSDRFDAFVICELARTEHHRFRVLEPGSDQTKALQALTRGREDLVCARTALTNQLRAEL